MHTTALFQAALALSDPWSVSAVEFDPDGADGRGQLDVQIDFRRGGRLPCPECSQPCSAHDTDTRSWRHLDFFQHVATLTARVPRVRCDAHGVLTAHVPWARPGSGFTLLFEALVMAFAAQMPMRAIGRLVGERDTRVWRIVNWHVEDARERVDMSEVSALTVDETAQAKRHRYVSLFLQPAEVVEDGETKTKARVLFVTEGRDHTTFQAFYKDFVAHGGQPKLVRDICMDMSAAFQKGAAETLPWAEVTFDRFHVMKLVNDAVDDARRRERPQAPELKGTRYDWLLNPSKLSAKRKRRVEELSKRNLLTAKAYQMRLNLAEIWRLRSRPQARRELIRWCTYVKRVAKRPDGDEPWVLEKIHVAATTIRAHVERVVNYFRLRLTSGVIEGVNSLVQAARARARGYRNPETFKTIIYLIAGNLEFDLPVATHSR